MSKELQPIERLLTSRQTHPDLAKIILRSVRCVLTGDTPTLNWSCDAEFLQSVKQANLMW
jgi:hypothetical protein